MPDKEIAEEGGEWEKEIVEKCAPAEHDRWARWMRWLFDKSDKNKNGTVTIPADCVERWERQSTSPYDALSEKEKEYDRIEVRKYLPVIRSLISRTRKEATEEVWRKANNRLKVEPCRKHKVFHHRCGHCNYIKGRNSARQKLITAAKEHGVNIEI